jgi:transcriptional regulator with XRE-family HTH domain
MDKKTVETLKRVRKNRGLSQGDVCKKLRISQSFYSQVENGKREMSMEKFFDLLTILECKFLIIDEKMNPKYAELVKKVLDLNIELK